MPQDERSAWVARVLGIDVSAATVPRSDAPADALDLRGRMQTAGAILQTMKAEGDSGLPDLIAMFQRASEALGAADGPALVNALEEALARAQSAARGREAFRANVRGIAYPKLLLRWRGAQTRARDALVELGQELLAMPEIMADPRVARVQAAVARLPGLIPDLGARLEDLLDSGISAGTDTAIAAEALGAVAEYRRRIAAATKLSALESFANRHAGGLATVTTLDGALAEIAQELSAAT